MIYDGGVFIRSRSSDILSLIHPVRKDFQSWFRVMGRLVNGSPALGIGTLAWSLVTLGTIRCTRQWWIIRCVVCVHGGGSLVSTMRVNPLCRTEPGILLMLGRSWGIGSIVYAENFSCQGHRRRKWAGTGWMRYLRRRCAWILWDPYVAPWSCLVLVAKERSNVY